MGQFWGMPVPWLRDHQSRSAWASALWNVRPMLTKIPANLKLKTRTLYHDLLTKWEGKIGKHVLQRLMCLPRTVKSLSQDKYILVHVTLLTNSIKQIYHANFDELDLDGSGIFFLWKFLSKCSELQTLNEFSNEWKMGSVAFSRPAYVDLSGLMCINSHNVWKTVNITAGSHNSSGWGQEYKVCAQYSCTVEPWLSGLVGTRQNSLDNRGSR